jgi:Tfp pilus assembly protein PilW
MWKLLIRQLRKSRSDGFSVSELLIGSVIAGMAVTGLLVLMVNLLQNNQREQASGSVEDDMRRALDYITRDLQEAVYIYTGEQLERNRPDPLVTSPIQGLTQYLPNFGTGVRPILAFWKVENLPFLLTVRRLLLVINR